MKLQLYKLYYVEWEEMMKINCEKARIWKEAPHKIFGHDGR